MELIHRIRMDLITNWMLKAWPAVCVFAVCVVVYKLSPITISGSDSAWVFPVALSIVREGNIELSEYKPLIDSSQHYGVQEIDNPTRYFYIFPVGSSIVSVPFVAMYDQYMQRLQGTDLVQVINQNPITTYYGIARDIAVLYVSSSAARFSTLTCADKQ